MAGIYSTNPGVLATPHAMDNTQLRDEVPLAIVGIVPCKVTAQNGPVEVGDLLVSSSLPGQAMKGTDRSRMLGAVVGKALEALGKGTGVIQVLVTLQRENSTPCALAGRRGGYRCIETTGVVSRLTVGMTHGPA